MKHYQAHIAKALKALREVESRVWYSILLSSVDPVNEAGEALKLLKIAACYQDFTREYANVDIETRLEAYAVLRAAYDDQHFPPRRHLSRAQFEYLLVLHLERF